ncbi:unnamed protein product [Lasius platythorax]|uniref:Uncharacterized protein n=1 Tax=Lasius platythorax TaxID=488582 RepID=A0AAV2NJY5_9HYME
MTALHCALHDPPLPRFRLPTREIDLRRKWHHCIAVYLMEWKERRPELREEVLSPHQGKTMAVEPQN